MTPLPPHVAASFALDGERWTLSYTAHTATALRRRVLAATNGEIPTASVGGSWVQLFHGDEPLNVATVQRSTLVWPAGSDMPASPYP